MGMIKGGWNDQATLGIPCPECGHKTEVLINKLIAEKACVCGGCNKQIDIQGDGLAQIEALKKTIQSLK